MTAPLNTAAQLARKEIALIHMGKAHLGLDEETYRALLAAKANGKTSSKDLTWQERKAVLEHMKASGFTVKPKGDRKDMGRNEAQMSKLRKMWHLLMAAGATEQLEDLVAVDKAIEAWAQRMLGPAAQVGSLRFASWKDMNKLLESMKAWVKRVGADKPASKVN